MPEYPIAHIRQQGQDIIIVPLDSEFGHKSEAEQHRIIGSFQSAAGQAGLAGTVVPVWLSGGRIAFIAPQPWHPFFRSLDWYSVQANLNRKLIIP